MIAAIFGNARRWAMAAGLALLAGCQGVPMGLPAPGINGLPVEQPTPVPATLPPAKGEIIGNGPVRVAMLLPLTAPGNAGVVAKGFRNAAALAVDDFAGSVELVVKDTAGVPNTATDAAGEAFNEGAAIVLGPLFSGNVSAVSGVLEPRGRMMIAFSSDASVARRGVYLNSFLPGDIIRRTLDHAAAQGVRRIMAIVPDGAFGILVERTARETLSRSGGELVGVVRYTYDDSSVAKAVADSLPLIARADAILLPDGGNTPGVFARQLREAGAELQGKRFLGSGQWSGAELGDAAFNGAWYADVDQTRLGQFATRYQQKYGEKPVPNMALGYDTLALVAGLARNGGAAALNAAKLESPGGFNGYAGLFRLRSDGRNERGYAVYEIREGKAHVVAPAPTDFRPGY
ncbi:penicillin-binding protein activator [Zhengella mangrovi]|uniref:Penicillin-binding protein activator n=1 Tax=Zhengella mangrovi TaxID=1982044 RepID=A0A2G1QTQ9_9HYPH|nr:penicillin-binding protein activator [Zhengella mangrovi]PHP68849.1 penicillin-binding protein activator [Zhengella mangrovi]